MVSAALHRRAPRGSRIAAEVIIGFGKVIGLAGTCSPVLVNLAGAALFCYGAALVYKPAGLILGGVFLLAMGRQLELRTPRAGNGRGG